MKTILFICSFLLFASTTKAQRLKTPTLSPFTRITQEIGLTEIQIEYARPSAKGRTIFGELVPYDKIWRTGANASTKIILKESAFIAENEIDAGTYAIYTIPGKEDWTVIIHGNTKMRSIAGDAYKEENDIFRFNVKPKNIDEYIETFTIQISHLTSNSCKLSLRWENTAIDIPIRVEVDRNIEMQMTEFLKSPETIPHRNYFEAAQYYLHNDKDLNEALEWINAGLKKSKHNFRYGLLKAKILNKKGDRKSALSTINEANEWATAAKNANYMEQTDLFRKSILEN